MITAVEIKKLVEAQLAGIHDEARRNALQAILVEPQMEMRDWDYGICDEQFPCWIVAVASDSKVKLAYCDNGFGPQHPWGAVFTLDPSFGMDSQWHSTLDGAFRTFIWQWH